MFYNVFFNMGKIAEAGKRFKKLSAQHELNSVLIIKDIKMLNDAMFRCDAQFRFFGQHS